MAPTEELDRLNQVTERHGHVPVIPEYSAPSARGIVRRSETAGIKVPLVIRRFQDRVIGPKGRGSDGEHNKIARDFYRKDFGELDSNQKNEVGTLHSKLFNPAFTHPYFQKGLTFIEARDLLIETYAAENDRKKYPPEILAALIDFRTGLEKDISEAAKAGGFFDEFSKADKALRLAVATKGR